jgi:hypothetical protein
MADTNILEKYHTIKQAALDTELVSNVTLCVDEGEVLEKMANADSRELIIIPVDFALLRSNSFIRFDIMIIDKVNNRDNEEYVLQSWANGMAFLTDLTSRLNYKENENTIVESSSFGTTRIGDEANYKTLTVIDSSLDISLDRATRIKY